VEIGSNPTASPARQFGFPKGLWPNARKGRQWRAFAYSPSVSTFLPGRFGIVNRRKSPALTANIPVLGRLRQETSFEGHCRPRAAVETRRERAFLFASFCRTTRFYTDPKRTSDRPLTSVAGAATILRRDLSLLLLKDAVPKASAMSEVALSFDRLVSDQQKIAIDCQTKRFGRYFRSSGQADIPGDCRYVSNGPLADMFDLGPLKARKRTSRRSARGHGPDNPPNAAPCSELGRRP
jgi:hypothetical protein